MVTKGGPHSGPPEGHPVVTKGVDPTLDQWVIINFCTISIHSSTKVGKLSLSNMHGSIVWISPLTLLFTD